MLANQKVRSRLKWLAYFTSLCMVFCVSAQLGRTQQPGEAGSEKVYAEIRDLPDGNGGTWNLAERSKEFKAKQFDFQKWRAAGRLPNAEAEKLWDDYYKYRVAEFSWKENLDSLPKKRDDFKKKDLRPCYNNETKVLELHTRLNNQLLQMLPALIVNNTFSPVARVNWTVMLGDLNEKEFQSGNPPVAHPGALVHLTNLFADVKMPDEVRAATIAGILRQITNPSKEQKKDDLKKLVDALRSVINLQADAKVKNRPGMVWLRRQSCTALGALALSRVDDARLAANTQEVVDAVLELVRDPAADLNTRSRAAYTLGTLQSRDYRKNSARAAIRSIADLAMAISKAQGKKSASQLSFMLSCLQTAIQGAEQNRGIAALPDIEKDSQDLLKALLAQIEAAQKIVSVANVPEEQVAGAIDTMGQEVEKLLPGSTPAAAAPAATPPGPATGGSRVTPSKGATGTVGVKE